MYDPSPPRMVKLQDDETVKFIELYRGERLLYDPNCGDYTNNRLRSAAARRISEAMAVSRFGPKEVMTKFQSLRSSYAQELRKIADSERSGAKDVYVPRVNWFHAMNSFVRPFVLPRWLTPTNCADSVEDESEQTNIEPSRIDSPRTADVTSTGQKKDPPTNFKRKAPTETWMSKVRRADPQIDCIVGAIEKLNEISRRASLIDKEDSYDYFGMYVASMLRSIGPPTAMRLEMKITRLVTEAMCPPSCSPPSPNSRDHSVDFF